MTEKPTPKREVAVSWSRESDRTIVFYATTDAVSDMYGLGDILPTTPNCYILTVDARYDFGEVLAYIEGYG